MEVGLVAGSGFASGINLYGVVALLGLFGRFGDAAVPDVLTHPVTIGVALALYGLEFIADKVPYLDNLWDAVHTIIRPLGAAALGYLLAGEVDLGEHLTAAAGSGGLAFVAHAAKATSRAAINTSPEPVSNVVVSLLEDGLVAGLVWFAVNHPVVAALVVVALTVLALVLTVTMWRFALRGIARLRDRWRRRTRRS